MKHRFSILDTLFSNWWLRHILFWIFVLNYLVWGYGITKEGVPFGPEEIKAAYLRIAMFIPGFMMVVYPLLYFLIPRYLVKKKYFLFITGLIGLIVFASKYVDVFQLNFHPINKFAGFSFLWGKNLLPFIHITGIATAIKFIKYAYFQEDRAAYARQQKTIAELELLKAQIHPHFLFNTLNNLFAHTLRNSSDSPHIVSKLSSLLRFMIYESREEYISLPEEIKLLNNYIDLEKLRYGQELNLSVTFSGDLEKKMIRPLLLLPLIENSFKHGLSQQLEEKWIRLHMHVDQNILYFELANSKDPNQVRSGSPGKSNGIGLENVKRRLELLYPGKYKLDIVDQGDCFLVNLTLQLIDKISIPNSVEKTSILTETKVIENIK
jgi:hypothetical protein